MLKKTQRDDRYADLTGVYAEQMDAAPEYDQAPPAPRPNRRDFDTDTEPTTVTRAQPVAAAESVVDAGSSFDGRYETGQDLRILGSVSGEIICRGLLTIERDASAHAKIQAQDLAVRGRIEGDVVCSGRLTITSTGVVSGTIKAATLVVEEGATLRGSVETDASASLDTPAAPPASITSRKERATEKEAPAASDDEPSRGSGRWNRTTREVPSFALVSAEERAGAPLERN
ncbi:MAG: polymer-forming cytoskeletal protein [Dehalococcoidia bacterium]|nr:polymer-forming cytoskeletal protein [Dehalococcoidia bacterium]